MTLEFQGKKYYRDLQGRYYPSAEEDTKIKGAFLGLEIQRGCPPWEILEGDPQVLAEKARLREYRMRLYPDHYPTPPSWLMPANP